MTGCWRPNQSGGLDSTLTVSVGAGGVGLSESVLADVRSFGDVAQEDNITLVVLKAK